MNNKTQPAKQIIVTNESIFDQILTVLEENGYKPKLDEDGRKFYAALLEYLESCQ